MSKPNQSMETSDSHSSVVPTRTFEELTEGEREQAVDMMYAELLQAVVEGGLRFDDAANADNLQARIDTALSEAERMRTPWFAGEYVHDAAEDDLRSMAQCEAFDALYVDPETRVIQLRATEQVSS